MSIPLASSRPLSQHLFFHFILLFFCVLVQPYLHFASPRFLCLQSDHLTLALQLSLCFTESDTCLKFSFCNHPFMLHINQRFILELCFWQSVPMFTHRLSIHYCSHANECWTFSLWPEAKMFTEISRLFILDCLADIAGQSKRGYCDGFKLKIALHLHMYI